VVAKKTKEWDGKQQLSRAVRVKSLPWVDTFERSSSEFVVWYAAKPKKGGSIKTIEVVGSFGDRAQAKIVADTVLSIVRPELALMTILADYAVFTKAEDLLHVVSHAAKSVPRRCPDCTRDQKIMKPFTARQTAKITEYIAGLDKSVLSWRVTNNKVPSDETIIPCMTRMCGTRVMARIPIHPAILAEPTVPIHLSGKLHRVPLKRTPVENWSNVSAVDPKTLSVVKTAMLYCDAHLSKTYGKSLVEARDLLLLDEMARVGAEMEATQKSMMFGRSPVSGIA
jgi:hypothetical protein